MDGTTKNLGRDFLTVQEAQLLTPHDQRIYGIIRKWMAYCKSRGAVLSYRLTPAHATFIQAEQNLYRRYIHGAECRLAHQWAWGGVM